MKLAICVALKNRSCVIVDKEDSLSYLHHVNDSIINCPDLEMKPWSTKDGKRILPLMPRMLNSLVMHKKPEDDWVVIVVDYKSTDVNVEEMMRHELGDKIPWHLETVETYKYFDRGGGLAKAAKIAEEKFHAGAVFFCDADIVFASRNVLDRAIEVSLARKFYYPVFFSFALDNHSKGFWRDTSYGNFACCLQDYKQTEGWFHNISWGWEDRALSDSIPEEKKVRERVSGFFHQWHPFQWEFRVKEYPVKEYIFKGAAVKHLMT